jgi:glycosyltransferase involved in cell wall biosynthesis
MTIPGSRPTQSPLLMHIVPGFGTGGAQSRIVALLNGFGPRFRHVIVSLNGDFRAAERIESTINVQTIALPVSANPMLATARLIKLLMDWTPQLTLTYNWGAIEAVIAASLIRFGPLIHTEDGFGDDEAAQQKKRRVFVRHNVLRYATRVIAPSRKLEDVMRRIWRLPEEIVLHLPNGVDTEYYQPADGPKLTRTQLVVGTAGQLRPEKRQDELIAVCAGLRTSVDVKLKIAGDGPERQRLERIAVQHNFAHHVEFLGHVKDLRGFYRDLDIFALTSSTEQMPVSILEAMATGLPVVSTDVGDVAAMVSKENVQFVVPPGPPLTDAFVRLASDPSLRCSIGAKNRTRSVECFSVDRMVANYHNLYAGLIRERTKGRGSLRGSVA